MWSGFLWQRMRDSNPRKRSQSPVCYRYTNPLSQEHSLLYALFRKSQEVFKKIFEFSDEVNLPPKTQLILPKGMVFLPKHGLLDTGRSLPRLRPVAWSAKSPAPVVFGHASIPVHDYG